MTRPVRLGIILIIVLTVIGTLALTLDDDKPPGKSTVTVKVDTLDKSPNKDRVLTVPQEAVDEAAEALSGDIPDSVPLAEADADHTGQRDETLENVSDPRARVQAIEANLDAQAENREKTEALPTAGASGGFPGCVTAFVSNQSSRRGVRPTVQVLHYTVSPNRPGRSDVNGITAFFNRFSTQASSHFVIDTEGNCNYIVPIEAKAWTQGGGNPWAISYEIIATGKEKVFLQAPGYAKLIKVMREVSRRTGIPMRRGQVSGCSPSRSGTVQHTDGGTCWGGHHDIGPFPFSTIVTKLNSGSAVAKAKPVDIVTCRKLNYWRSHGRREAGRANATRRRVALRKRGIVCTVNGPVKRRVK